MSNHQQTTKKQNKPPPPSPIVATLDLHGYRKVEAMQRVTRFLEESKNKKKKKKNCWVAIITGRGAHSGGTGGPILRAAVQQMLERRQMEYRWMIKRGGFYVNANTGIVLVAPCSIPATDTKIQIVEAPPSRRQRRASLGDYGPPPTLKEATADEVLLFQTKLASKREEKEKNVQQRLQLQEALRASSLEFEKHSLCLQREEEAINRALLESKLSQEKDEELLENALRESQREWESWSCGAASRSRGCSGNDGDDALHKAIQNNLRAESVSDDLEKTLQLSLTEMQNEEAELRKVLSMSLQETA
mmetsp:Transcript_27762/g.64303  ORF Transcript_27762/g.64303 Transcript_27762/m.64303 type:complete len:304 (+) Transcript_27762:481-1392(+)|eukprot:CAMPEP_0116849638 /NCGR_PEP_ID=MMETSP0418-20121206/15690_1 /TAXON_ID=1158023 /ORGANISM="Astrosyne radiata, Strain 13vi08-1A" /LENGTH=303 /DNA_ID=CAMNT_0004481395 /DNA_START=1532 /DNA_END=2443 /DNA_ORIENTATION=+